MTNDTRDHDIGRGALRNHLPRPLPPPALSERVTHTLRARGLVRPSASRRAMWMARAGLIAAGFALGLVATRVDRRVVPSRHGEQTGRYALLLYGDTRGDSDAVHQARSTEYGRWASNLTGGARWVGGHELGAVIETLGAPREDTRTSADRVAGFFIIEATSPDHAAEVARTCPHLKYGGRVVVMTVVS